MSLDVSVIDSGRLSESLLYEVLEHLGAYLSDDVPRAVDLRSLPLTSDDHTRLREALGRGEVEVELSVAGTSEIFETRYAGIWWVVHRGRDGATLTETIEITRCPEVLASHRDDMAAAFDRLSKALSEGRSRRDE